MKYSACASLLTRPLTGSWYRVVDWAYLNTPLAFAHTTTSVSRFNAGNALKPVNRYACLYFADSSAVALLESGAVMGKFGPGKSVPHPSKSVVIPVVTVSLHHVTDLSEVTEQKKIATNVQELTGDWDGYQTRTPFTNVQRPIGRAPTQSLGLSLYRAGIEAFTSVSARDATHKTLIVFPANMRKGSFLTFYDPNTRKTIDIKGTL